MTETHTEEMDVQSSALLKLQPQFGLHVQLLVAQRNVVMEPLWGIYNVMMAMLLLLMDVVMYVLLRLGMSALTSILEMLLMTYIADQCVEMESIHLE